MENCTWIDAKKQSPPPIHGRTKSYLVVLETDETDNDYKTWVGMGEPEIAAWCSDWVYEWNTRGALSVAYWMPLPVFNGTWVHGNDGECGRWELKGTES